jgi:uncharacterized lipoprotein
MTRFKFIGILVLGLILITACNTSNNTSREKNTYEKILESEKIRVGYISYPPSFNVNPDGSYGGIFYETIEKIGENWTS